MQSIVFNKNWFYTPVHFVRFHVDYDKQKIKINLEILKHFRVIGRYSNNET